eukprot:6483950-Amphidinium_carterae.1
MPNQNFAFNGQILNSWQGRHGFSHSCLYASLACIYFVLETTVSSGCHATDDWQYLRCNSLVENVSCTLSWISPNNSFCGACYSCSLSATAVSRRCRPSSARRAVCLHDDVLLIHVAL